jgi:hypothetical protein
MLPQIDIDVNRACNMFVWIAGKSGAGGNNFPAGYDRATLDIDVKL